MYILRNTGSINNSYSELNPFTCKILICLTIVLFPDSPAPEKKKREKKTCDVHIWGRTGTFMHISRTISALDRLLLKRKRSAFLPPHGTAPLADAPHGKLNCTTAPPKPPPYPAEASGAWLYKPTSPSATASLFFCWLLAALSHRSAGPPFCCCPNTPWLSRRAGSGGRWVRIRLSLSATPKTTAECSYPRDGLSPLPSPRN